MTRFDIFGVKVSIADQERCLESIKNFDYEKFGYICLANVSNVVESVKKDNLRRALNESFMTALDGKPLEFYARVKKITDVRTVSGYWLLRKLLSEGRTHFFYGADASTLSKIKDRIEKEYPDARVLGYASPPFIAEDDIDSDLRIKKDLEDINRLGPDIIWIGIGSPKQDLLMNYARKHMAHGLMIGVGAAFGHFAGTVKMSPEWVKRIGFRWLYRIIQEPRRLWWRYLKTNSIFLWLLTKEFLGITRKA